MTTETALEVLDEIVRLRNELKSEIKAHKDCQLRVLEQWEQLQKLQDADLKDFLERHESDIAYSVDDFGGLDDIFEVFFERAPRK